VPGLGTDQRAALDHCDHRTGGRDLGALADAIAAASPAGVDQVDLGRDEKAARAPTSSPPKDFVLETRDRNKKFLSATQISSQEHHPLVFDYIAIQKLEYGRQ